MARPGPTRGQLHVGRYFIALLLLFTGLYATVVFAGNGNDWLKPKLGLDLRGGAQVILTPKAEGGKKPNAEQLAAAVGILRQRVDANGVSEAEIVVQGEQIVISVPGGNRDSITRATKAAQMEFRRVIECQALQAGNGCTQLPFDQVPEELLQPTESPSASASPTATPAPSTTAAVVPKPSATANKRPVPGGLLAAAPSPSPSATPTPSPSAGSDALLSGAKYTAETYATLNCGLAATRAGGADPRPNDEIVACDRSGTIKYHLAKATVYGKDIKGAAVGTDPTSNEVQVNLSFKGKGQDAWTQLTKDTYNQTPPTNQVAITLDGIVITSPVTNNIIYGDATITGSFTTKEGQDLANNLKFGALPLSFAAGDAQVVSATLGDDQLRSGLLAGGIGLIAVVIYSLLYYRMLGFVTIASLSVSVGLVYGSICVLGDQLGFALSLAGIAGFIVSVGITADSFVVFFERLKDEIKEGRTPRVAVDRAWVRARRTIISANMVSLIAAVILYFVSVGNVRGFAFTLGLSTALDVVVVFLFTRPLISWLARFRWFGKSRITGLFGPDGGDAATAGRTPPSLTATKEA